MGLLIFVVLFQTVCFLKLWLLFVFIRWQLNNPAVREFGDVFIDIVFFLEVSETKGRAGGG